MSLEDAATISLEARFSRSDMVKVGEVGDVDADESES